MGKVVKFGFIMVILSLVMAGGAYAIDTDESFVGDSGADNLDDGTSDDEYFAGLEGNDDIVARGGEDDIEGGPGRDDISAGRGADVVDGGSERDDINGDSGNDIIDAADDDPDEVNCGSGSDVVFYDDQDDLNNCERERLAEAAQPR